MEFLKDFQQTATVINAAPLSVCLSSRRHLALIGCDKSKEGLKKSSDLTLCVLTIYVNLLFHIREHNSPEDTA